MLFSLQNMVIMIYFIYDKVQGDSMKKSNGFTLIELLGVIIVLAVIAVLVYPAIEKSLKNSKQDVYEAQLSLIRSALEQYAVINRKDLPQHDGEYVTVTLQQLVNAGLVSEDIQNPLTGEAFTEDELDLVITRYHNNYTYHVNDNTVSEPAPSEPNPTVINPLTAYISNSQSSCAWNTAGSSCVSSGMRVQITGVNLLSEGDGVATVSVGIRVVMNGSYIYNGSSYGRYACLALSHSTGTNSGACVTNNVTLKSPSARWNSGATYTYSPTFTINNFNKNNAYDVMVFGPQNNAPMSANVPNAIRFR